MTRKTYQTPVICLSSKPYKEADRLVTFFSPERGKISAIAKGTQKQQSKLSGACQVLSISTAQLADGKSLDVLCQYQPVQAFSGVRSDLLKLACALLWVKLLALLATEHDLDSPALFDTLHKALVELDGLETSTVGENQQRYQQVLSCSNRLQLSLLSAFGYAPTLDECIQCGMDIGSVIEQSVPYYPFWLHAGGVLCHRCHQELRENGREQSTEVVNVSTATLLTLCGRSEEGEPFKTQRFLRFYIEHKLEREISAYNFLFSQLEEG